ncbi:BTB/POZ domain-containing protein At1g63850-like [Chenopodium quinoa]|uniref:At3g05675-like ankyrin-like domain-containing protein n=1 Tax=Chenopodium quinoa TaxID=63459 RepID=A0A803LP55_CHEQI|nr:BTB/POZ domain-containing protein At1g63850-like [Chenopodium quinoa]
MSPYNNNSNNPIPKKRHRINSSTRLSSLSSAADSSVQLLSSPISGGFNDAPTADILLRLFHDSDSLSSIAETSDPSSSDELQVYLHSSALCRAKYFSALFSDRWSKNDDDRKKLNYQKVNLAVSPKSGSINSHLVVLRLLYSEDLSNAVNSAATAISILPVAMKLLFDDLVKQCVRFLEAVPWSEEEEEEILNLVPFLSEEESKELLARVSTSKSDSCEQMLDNLLVSAKQNHPNLAPVKAFVARLLREFSSRESARRALEKAFLMSLKVVKGSLEEYSSPDFRGDHAETEAIQRLNLHTALTNGKHLVWLVERMIELRVAEMAVKEWSEQDSFAADLQRAFRDDAWRNIVPGLPTVVLKCTSKLACAVASGNILVARQVRMKFVKDWLPVLIICKDNASPVLPSHKPVLHSSTTLYLELEEIFLKIISTLPMDDAQELLQQCLSFSTRDSEDCPHLITAFNTWFRCATRPSLSTSFS